jgi:tRNA-splicing ligase RtcB/release factor H-coupled RctB family protein
MKNITYFIDESEIEESAKSQLVKLLGDDNILEMCVYPDIHYASEKSIPVGVAFKTKNLIYPLISGNDTGCGVSYMKIPKRYYMKSFDKDKYYNALYLEHINMCDEGLGSGNHFLSIEEDDDNLYIIVHTGTRNLGIYWYQKNLSLLSDFGDVDHFDIDVLNNEYPKWFEEYENLLNYGRLRRSSYLEKTLAFLVRSKHVIYGDYETGDSIHNYIELIDDHIIHRKGATALNNRIIVMPISMVRGCLFVKSSYNSNNLNSCSHGSGRRLCRFDTVKCWKSTLKNKERAQYKLKFSELLNKSGNFTDGQIQEFDFAYKDSSDILSSQPFLYKITETKPICTIKTID